MLEIVRKVTQVNGEVNCFILNLFLEHRNGAIIIIAEVTENENSRVPFVILWKCLEPQYVTPAIIRANFVNYE